MNRRANNRPDDGAINLVRAATAMRSRTLGQVRELNVSWMAAVAGLLREKQQLIEYLDDDDTSPQARAMLRAQLLRIYTVLSWFDPD
jgi:hypothetical protein